MQAAPEQPWVWRALTPGCFSKTGSIRMGYSVFLSMPNADSFVWQFLTRNGVNPYWGEIEHYHNFGRQRLNALLQECGFEPVHYAASTRYRACMEVIAMKRV